MTFWERFRLIWSKRKHESTLTEIESLRREIRQGRVRLAIKQMPEYPVFREWLEDILFAYYQNSDDPSEIIKAMASAKAIDSILSKFESLTPEQIEIDEKNLKTLQGR